MKPRYYVIVLLALILSSCSKDNLDNDITNYDITEIDLGQEDSNSRQFDQSKDVEGSCFSAPLITSDYNRVGSVYFTVLNDDIRVTFQTNRDLAIMESHISITNCESKEFPVDAEGNIMMDEFQYTASSTINPNETSILIEKEISGAYFCFAGYAKLSDPKGNPIEVWANDWETYAKTYIGDCGVWTDEDDVDDVEDEYEYCNDNNTKVYICHNGKTICVSVNAIDAHLAHGDALGQCDDD